MNSLVYMSITPRDRAVEKTVRYLRQVTSSQLRRIHFSEGSELSAGNIQRRRCKRLVELGIIARMPRLVGGIAGSGDYIYVPTESKSRQVNMHTLELSEIYTRLVEAQRQGVLQNLDYQSEPYCWEKIGNIHLMPDAHVRYTRDGYKFDVWLELDRATEYRTKLGEKARRFVKAYKVWDEPVFPRVLFVVPESERLDFVRGVFKRQEVPQIFDICLFDELVEKLCSIT